MKLKGPSFPIKSHVSKLKRYANENVNWSGGRVSLDWIVSFMGPMAEKKTYLLNSILLFFNRISSSFVCSKLYLSEAGCRWLYFWLCSSVVRVNGPIHRTSDCTMRGEDLAWDLGAPCGPRWNGEGAKYMWWSDTSIYSLPVTKLEWRWSSCALSWMMRNNWSVQCTQSKGNLR